MSKSYNQKSKILYLIKILWEQTDEEHPLNAAELIEKLSEYEISAERKSIYDDMQRLKEFGIGVVQKKGRGNSGYYLANRTFTLPELKVLVDVVQSSRFITKSKSEELIHKLETFANRYDGRQLQRQVYVASRVKASNEEIYDSVDQIHQALNEGSQICFTYLDWNLQKKLKPRRNGHEYVVSPWSLAWNAENYYLIAYDEEECKIKHYRVDKMGTIRLNHEKRKGQEAFADFDVAQYCNRTFNMYGGREEMLTLQFENHLLGVMVDRFGKEVSIRKRDEQHFSVRVPVAVSGQFFGWLAGIGKQVQILSPESVRLEYRKYLQDLIE